MPQTRAAARQQQAPISSPAPIEGPAQERSSSAPAPSPFRIKIPARRARTPPPASSPLPAVPPRPRKRVRREPVAEPPLPEALSPFAAFNSDEDIPWMTQASANASSPTRPTLSHRSRESSPIQANNALSTPSTMLYWQRADELNQLFLSRSEIPTASATAHTSNVALPISATRTFVSPSPLLVFLRISLVDPSIAYIDDPMSYATLDVAEFVAIL
ncbi:hypothetical protein SCP_1503130 [Sparassis crispa]|uniref:Uncharacterized protein n=1 Tax=Sparassis crispa TaxID=139825 RepID=A0A401H4D8_9APHY|nr:hypothetical protein SCP_1503130 [Sparassis crispa]GBE89305.1 hypothetical protein SCP_1503130 [Sparassis crispa]